MHSPGVATLGAHGRQNMPIHTEERSLARPKADEPGIRAASDTAPVWFPSSALSETGQSTETEAVSGDQGLEVGTGRDRNVLKPDAADNSATHQVTERHKSMR